MLHKFRDNQGSAAPEIAVGFLVFMMFLVLAVTFLPQYVRKQELDTAATEIARYIEIKGVVNDDVYYYVEEIKDVINMDFNCSIDADYYGSSRKIQLEKKFKVTLSYDSKFGIGGVISVPLPIKGHAYGVSEKYIK
ncbi:uncharacterized protein DUF4320 [Hydrogenoanaerobacterium saccharovorans]|uniref:DUF4320 family protein n=1 Tax=Hydrogenoanaerobacterium saccharovorans TaxID=474960 RepID=A0A1H8CZB3_9FIRM|nr:DUF4320 family protein [Hydrogenoanaerobacterium saccharovorans]RPF43396.1 uncharacterized protein DUF4320 [Hydrogenoanaerobacterium saccharovorans]SEN00272.1 protein of unknown function [Hydrogenoanaerobacterium saccharovorans]